MPSVVLYPVSTLADCGPVNVLWGIVRHLNRQEYRPIVVTLSQEPGKSAMGRFVAAGLEIRQLNMSRGESLWRGNRRIREVIADTGAEIVHCHGIRATLLVASEAPRHPLCVTLHCDLGHYYRIAYGRWMGALMAHLEYRALSRYSLVAAVSDSIGETVRSRGIRSSTISNGIDLDTYCPPRDGGEIERIRAGLGWPAGSVVVLHTGALSAGKRPVEIIECFLSTRSSDNCLLVFAGDGPLKNRCLRAANNSRRIVFLGPRSDVADLLKAANILISNSVSEGLPLALIEGCASGLSILASDIPAHRWIQKALPSQVVLFREDLHGQLESAMANCVNDTYFRVRPSGEALEAISDRRMSACYQRAYRDLLAERRTV
jgi:glycosyltransferase involved in cell wall biosynthesis